MTISYWPRQHRAPPRRPLPYSQCPPPQAHAAPGDVPGAKGTPYATIFPDRARASKNTRTINKTYIYIPQLAIMPMKNNYFAVQ